MMVNLSPVFYLQLADLLEKLGKDADQHEGLHDDEPVIEYWVPVEELNEGSIVRCEITVGDLRLAKRLYFDLWAGREIRTQG